MVRRLCAFAKGGEPNSEGLCEWHSGGKSALVLGDADTCENKPSALKMWVTMFTNKAPGE